MPDPQMTPERYARAREIFSRARRLTGDRAATAKSVAAIMEWPMQRVVMAHGDVVTEQAAAELSAGLWWWQGIERRPPIGSTGSADQMVRA